MRKLTWEEDWNDAWNVTVCMFDPNDERMFFYLINDCTDLNPYMLFFFIRFIAKRYPVILLLTK